MALVQAGGVGRGRRVAIALEDRVLRESLAMALAEAGYRLLEFAQPDTALGRIEAGTDVDALVVDTFVSGNGAPDDGAWPRDRLRAARCASPVFVLSGHGEAQAAADRWGAAGVIDRTQPLASLKRNLIQAIRAGALIADSDSGERARSLGPLVMAAGGTQVSWKGSYLDLSSAERALLSGLVSAPPSGLTTRRAQAILADHERAAGADAVDEDGGAARVKALVRRLRKKFREVDPEFDQIVFVPGCGYGWRGGGPPTP